MGHLFISYSKRDIEFARRLRSALQDRGFAVWMDEAKLVPSERWWPTIEQNILSASGFIVIMSPNSRRSRWVEREILVAEREDVDKPIFPVLLAGDGWSRLADLQYEDMTRGLALRPEFIAELQRVAPPSGQPPPPQIPVEPIPTPTGSGRSLPLIVALFALIIVVVALVVTNLNGQANRSPESTPITTAVSQLATNTVTPETPATDLPTQTLARAPTTDLPTLTASPSPPTATATPTPIPPTPTVTGPTPLPPGFPTPVIARIRMSEQRFERGRMLWVQGNSSIRVLWNSTTHSGTWTTYADTFSDTEPWSDPNIIAPAGRYQPERGFGKLWRESPNLRDQLGWAITLETYYNADYTYYAGGSVDTNGNFTRGSGYSLFEIAGFQTIRLNDNYTWDLLD